MYEDAVYRKRSAHYRAAIKWKGTHGDAVVNICTRKTMRGSARCRLGCMEDWLRLVTVDLSQTMKRRRTLSFVISLTTTALVPKTRQLVPVQPIRRTSSSSTRSLLRALRPLPVRGFQRCMTWWRFLSRKKTSVGSTRSRQPEKPEKALGLFQPNMSELKKN